MVRPLALGMMAALLFTLPRPTAAAPASTEADTLVSTGWLHQHLDDPHVRVIFIGEREHYDRGHIPGARRLDHMDTVGDGHRLLPVSTLRTVLARAGAADDARVILYGDRPMEIGWVYMALATVGRGDAASLLDGNIDRWRADGYAVSTAAVPPASSSFTVGPATDVAVDAAWVKSHLTSPAVRLLDVRTTDEWNDGHLPGATLVLWQDLLADPRTQAFKSRDELRALFERAGVKPGQQIVTYCAVGLRASLMYWAALTAGLPARVYVGSFQDWRQDRSNPIVR